MQHPTSPPHPLKAARLMRGLRQQDLAELAGVTRESISRFESGEMPRLTTARAIAHALEAPVDSVFPPAEAHA